jgi:hypothetical protein
MQAAVSWCVFGSAAPTGAPTLAAYSIVEAFCGDGSAPCRVEGGDTLTVIGRGFADVSALAVLIDGVECSSPATSVASGAYGGFEKTTCTTLCFSKWGSALAITVTGTTTTASVTFDASQSFRGNALVQVTTAGAYTSAGVLDYACASAPTITDIACVNAAGCSLSGNVLTIPPNGVLEISGTNFGRENPSGSVAGPVELRLGGSVACNQFTTWSASQISIWSCASAGTSLAVTLTIGGRTSAAAPIAISVSTPDSVPQAATLSLAPSAGSTASAPLYDATLTWQAPASVANALGYVVKFTPSPNGWGSWTQRAALPLGTRTWSFSNLASGATLRAKVGMAYSSDAAGGSLNDDTTWAPDAFTADTLIQGAVASAKPSIATVTFIGVSDGASDAVDMLVRFALGSFNGGAPDLALIDYTPDPYRAGAGLSLGGATVQLTTELTQFGVIAKFPINVLAGVALTVRSTRSNGLAKAVDILTSEASDAVQLRVRVPRAVQLPLVALDATDGIAEGATAVSVTVSWTSGVEEEGNAPTTGHLVRMRTVAVDAASGSFTCELATAGAAMTCVRAALASSAYSVNHSGGSIAGVPVGRTACFVIQAENALGLGALSATEACIDVHAVCDAGAVIGAPTVYRCDACGAGRFAPLAARRCAACPVGSIPNEAQSACAPCRVGTFAESGASTCALCGARGVECAGGEITLTDGWWYVAASPNATAARAAFGGDTRLFECLAPAACRRAPGTASALRCAAHAGGALCAVCDDGYVPDDTAADGSCGRCASTEAERWVGKAALLLIFAGLLSALALAALTKAAPRMKFDKVIVALHVRRVVRRARKRVLRRLLENDRRATEPLLSPARQEECAAHLAANRIDSAVALRRAAYAARSAGLAALVVGTSIASGGAPRAAALALGGAASGVVADEAGAAIGDALGDVDVDGQLADGNGAVRRASVFVEGGRAAARAGGGSATSCFAALRGVLAPATAAAIDWISPAQLQIVMGNLQINASLTVVFAVPWPPLHTRFLAFLNVFKLDLFKGFAFAAPCLHSSHFMSLAMFVAAPPVLVAVFAAAFAVACVAKRVEARCCDRRQQRAFRKLPCGRFTTTSAASVAIKLAIVLLMVLYPTLCSKVFTTFACVNLGESGFYMIADMSVRCFGSEWAWWAALSSLAMLVYIVGIPLTFVALLYRAKRRGTLHFPKAPPLTTRAEIMDPEALSTAVRRLEEFFHHREAYGNIYENYEARCVTPPPPPFERHPPSHSLVFVRALRRPRSLAHLLTRSLAHSSTRRTAHRPPGHAPAQVLVL